MFINFPQITVSVTNWNNKFACIKCLESIYKLKYPKDKLDVLVVDNGSSDGSVSAISKKFPTVKIISLPKNEGFPASVNIAVKSSKSKYTLILASDEVLDKFCLLELVKVMESNNKIALAGGKQFKDKNFKKIHFLWGEVDKTTFHIKRIGEGNIDKGQYDKVRESEYVCFTGLIRNSALIKIGFVDERYFFSFDDLDTTLRLKDAGYKIMFVPRAKMWHQNKYQAFPKKDFRTTYYLVRNNLLIKSKFKGFSLSDHLKNIKFLGSSLFLGFLNLGNKKDQNFVVAKGIFDFYINRFGSYE